MPHRLRDHDHERAEDVRAALVEAARDRAADPGRQVLDGAVPAQRDRPRPRKDLVAVDDVELEVGQLLGQPRPVAVEDVPVVVVVRERILGRFPGGLGELGALPDCVN